MNQEEVNEKNIGMPKSGKPWKKHSKKFAPMIFNYIRMRSKRFNKTTWEDK